MRRASAKVSAPTGMIMNSWMSRLLGACSPPLMMFIIGTGSSLALVPPRYWYRGMPMKLAAARAAAMDTPRMALAPSRSLFSVPSRSMSALSRVSWRTASMPMTAPAISPRTFSTAWRTPLPPYRSSLSRSSKASREPVDAPEGTAARPMSPDSRITSHSTVGLPRESRISRAQTPVMMLISISLNSGLYTIQTAKIGRILEDFRPMLNSLLRMTGNGQLFLTGVSHSRRNACPRTGTLRGRGPRSRPLARA